MKILGSALYVVTVISAGTASAQTPPETKGCVCAYNNYTVQDTQMALSTARVTRPGDFPVRFWNVQGFSFVPYCKPGPYKIFPLRQGVAWNDDLKPRADRLVYSEINGQFCGCVTHTGAPRKGFFHQCTVYDSK